MAQSELFPFESPAPAEMKDVGKGKAVSKAEQAKLMDLEEPTAKEKEKAAKEKADRKSLKEEAEAKKAEDTKRSNLAQRPMISPKGNVFKGATSGGGMPSDKTDKMKKMNYKAGGSVSSASKRADGCTIKGKTRGRMV
jgi:hypothetical protein